MATSRRGAAQKDLESAWPSDLRDPRLYINRELSWLEFNHRVIEEASDPATPPLERLKFLAIAAGNLDEFFMVRVSGLLQQAEGEIQDRPADGMSPSQQLEAIAERAHRMVAEKHRIFREEVMPLLAHHGIRVLGARDLGPSQRRRVTDHFERQIAPVLTPLAVDPGHPFPHLRNHTLNLAVLLRPEDEPEGTSSYFAVVPVPSVLPRLVPLPSERRRNEFVLLDDVISMNVEQLFPGLHTVGCWPFRVTRNGDLFIDEEEAEDLLEVIEKQVRRRLWGVAVRLEIDTGAPSEVVQLLQDALELGDRAVFRIEGPLNLTSFKSLCDLPGWDSLREKPFTQRVPVELAHGEDLFEEIRKRDHLLHHPFDSFAPFLDLLASAAEDPSVLAIKQTLYRTSGDSQVVKALERAAENGKQVTALVELKARFDEEANITWARRLEDAGVHVVYGLIGLKTHCKICMVVRREGEGLVRYVHLSTGNYNPSTARTYTDLGLFTADPEIGEDATALFNLLTGYARVPRWNKFVVAPLNLHRRVLDLIEGETAAARRGRPARIIAKLNSLSEPEVIRALYRANQAGVEIDLVVRGICCLRPGIPGISERIRVRSVVGRFLEHTRILYFQNGGPDGDSAVYLSSADWMTRNFHRRVEVMFPVEDRGLKDRVLHEILDTYLAGNTKARVLRPDGTYGRVVLDAGEPQRHAQAELLQRAERRVGEEGKPVPRGYFRVKAPGVPK
ncbi:polyphosphate kinase 1 [Myxococcota bacterium]|nr:polyphosphate kinase 1 [Myxococcota bacterium]